MQESASELRRLLAELDENTQMGGARKQKMRGFLRRHAARLFAKRGGAGRAELEVLQNAQVAQHAERRP